MILYLLILLFIIYLCFTRKEGFTNSLNDSFDNNNILKNFKKDNKDNKDKQETLESLLF